MGYSLIRLYDDPDSGRHGGFQAHASRDVDDIFDPETDYRIYVAM